MFYDVTIDAKVYKLELNHADGRWFCRLDGHELEVDAIFARPDVLSLRIGNMAYEVKAERMPDGLHLWVGPTHFAAEVRDPRSLRGRIRTKDDDGPKRIVASMPGKVVRLLVHEGDEVEPGVALAVVEAMKMQNEIKSPKKGTVRSILAGEGSAVNAGDVIAIVE